MWAPNWPVHDVADVSLAKEPKKPHPRIPGPSSRAGSTLGLPPRWAEPGSSENRVASSAKSSPSSSSASISRARPLALALMESEGIGEKSTWSKVIVAGRSPRLSRSRSKNARISASSTGTIRASLSSDCTNLSLRSPFLISSRSDPPVTRRSSCPRSQGQRASLTPSRSGGRASCQACSVS